MKTAVVTGASRGIGEAIAKRLAQDGMQVVVNYSRSAEAAERVVGSISEQGGTAFAVQADMGDLEQIRYLFAQTQERFDTVDILVNNAGTVVPNGLAAITPNEYEQQFALNVRGVLFAMQEATNRMANGGRIINITSGAATACPPGMGVYNASKAAIDALTLTFAIELGSRQITVNAVAPGFTESEMLRGLITDEMLPGMIAMTPLGRLGTPEDIADVVAFLASEQARWITGQVIGVSGGLK